MNSREEACVDCGSPAKHQHHPIPRALRRRVVALRKRGVALPDIGRELVRDGYDPIGEKFWTGSLSKIARGETGR